MQARRRGGPGWIDYLVRPGSRPPCDKSWKRVMMDDAPGAPDRLPRWTLVLCVLAGFVGILDRDAWTPDEPRDAAVSLEMGRTGNWVVPHLAGRPFVEKPPLYFAVGGAFARAAGPWLGEVGAIRLSTAAWGCGTLLMTFLLARRLLGRDGAMLSAAALATMWGFVVNLHWIRVDAALVFCVCAAFWAFAEAYVGNRPWCLLLGGLFASGAFLAKGAIGPVLVASGWLGLAVPWAAARLRKAPDGNGTGGLLIAPHLLALLAFLVPAGAWMLAFRETGGRALWDEWLLENHLGRFTGSASGLGHVRRGAPLYYVWTLAAYGLPWTPLVAVGLWDGLAALRARWRAAPSRDDPPPVPAFFLMAWAGLSLLVLSLSATKRDVYLAPVLPALAMLCAVAVRRGLPRWCRGYVVAWIFVAAAATAALGLTPLLVPAFEAGTLGAMGPFLSAWTPRHAVAGACFAASLAVALGGKRWSAVARCVAASALLVVAAWTVAGRAVDAEKSMCDDFRAFAAAVSAGDRPRVAGWDLSETDRACLVLYGDWSVPPVGDPDRLRKIVAGEDREFDQVLVARDPSGDALFGRPVRVLAACRTGDRSHRRGLFLVARPAGSGPSPGAGAKDE